ncbi:MAG: exported protein of unknown function [Parcubacteria group bacterium Gr01-1014_56]|nr:MAG: exported protein of unknown function [Parcubacteria group bacterium Gr01-1014_56]
MHSSLQDIPFRHFLAAFAVFLFAFGTTAYIAQFSQAATFALGDRVEVTATHSIREFPPKGPILGTQPPGALGVVIGGPSVQDGGTWWQINYDTGVDGWSTQSYFVATSAPRLPVAPTLSLGADPTFLAPGQSTSLTWSSSDADTCTASGGWSGGKALRSFEVVSPTVDTTYTLTCVGPYGTVSQSISVAMGTLGGTTNCISGPSTEHVRLCSVTRSLNNPLISPTTHPGIGPNITMPSVIKVPTWLPSPLGQYYMYFASHNGTYIRLAYANSPAGPWTNYAPGTLKDTQVAPFSDTISSPDVFVRDGEQKIRMYFSTDRYPGSVEQWSGVSESTDGINFTLTSTENIAKYYLRVFQWAGQYFGLQKGWSTAPADLGASLDGIARFNLIKTFTAQGSVRHMAVLLKGDVLMVFYTKIGDAPERIWLSTIQLNNDPSMWELSSPIEVLRPTTAFEGVNYPVTPSYKGGAVGVNQLRDPYVFEENGKTYLYYAISGESGIAMAEITYDLLTNPVPTISISASPTAIPDSGSATLSWNAGSVDTCTASGSWSGARSTSGSESVTPTQDATYILSCGGPYGSVSAQANVTIAPLPTLTMSATPGAIVEGQSSTLTWTSTNATSCTASGGWNGTRALSGSESVAPTQNTTYTLTCTSAGGVVTEQVAVAVALLPAVSISASPTFIITGSSSTLTWSSANATNCSASGGWSGVQPTAGTQNVTPLVTTTYMIVCTNANGSASGSATVSVSDVPPTPTVTFSANPLSVVSGQSSTLTWSSTDTTDCTASGGWSGAKAVSGSQSVTPSATTTYTLMCSGAGGSATQSVVVGVTAPPAVFGIGARISTTANLNIRASAPKGTVLGTQLLGAQGTIIGGPAVYDNKNWWQIDFDTGVDGWAVQTYLKL